MSELSEVKRKMVIAAAIFSLVGSATMGALILLSSQTVAVAAPLATAEPIFREDMLTIASVALASGLIAVGVQNLAQRRSSPRFRCRMPGGLEIDGDLTKVRAENISRGGAQLHCGKIRLAEGDWHTIRLGDFATRAEVRWTQGSRAGVRFEEMMDENAFEALLEAAKKRSGFRERRHRNDRALPILEIDPAFIGESNTQLETPARA